MKRFKSHFRFNKQERSGIFFLLSIIFILQLGSFLIKSINFDVEENGLSLNSDIQMRIDSLKAAVKIEKDIRLKSVNPNYISDYKGYVLGMSLEEIDRLHKFRASGAFVYTTDQFKEITQVDDSLLAELSPHFQFPRWKPKVSKKKPKSEYPRKESLSTILKQDLNRATKDDLKKIYGIGEVLSARIIKFRTALGGFLVEEQLYDVYGLDSAVVERVLQRFTLEELPPVAKVNINSASATELSQNIYISRTLANQIIRFRDSLGMFHSMNQLTKIQDFPSDKIERIKLYLTL